MRDDKTTIKGNFATVTVRNDHGPNPECNRGQLYLELEGGNFTGLDADELRDAIDKAVGPREADKLFGDQAIIYHKVAMHPAFDEFWTVDSTPSAEAMIEKLDELFDSSPAPAKPYRPADRDRLLRHIEDIEATLARRNRRHEEDQERIRELEEIAMRRGDRIEELEAEAAAPAVEEQIEALPIGHEVRLDPPRWLSEIPGVGEGGYVTRVFIQGYIDEGSSPKVRMQESDREWWVDAKHVIEMGLRAEDFKPHDEVERERLKGAGLADWQIELLMGGDA